MLHLCISILEFKAIFNSKNQLSKFHLCISILEFKVLALTTNYFCNEFMYFYIRI